VTGREDWMAVASGDPDDVRERILTGYKDGKPFTPYVPTLPLPSPIERVLDFGCGLGRNFAYLTRIARSVSGFDLPPMIDRCRALAPERVELLTSDWAELAATRFDLIVASLVLQHIEPEPTRAFLCDFAQMTPAVYLLTRTRTDFDENIFDVISGMGIFQAGPCVEVDHDPITHQLRVLGRTTISELVGSRAEGHYEVLLASVGAP
jgi:SAM-dependent methyltransferase